MLTDELWLKNADHANRMAARLAAHLARIPGIALTQKVEVNSVFATVPPEIIPVLLDRYFFYVWDEVVNEVRWMTSFNTTEDDVDQFANEVTQAAAAI